MNSFDQSDVLVERRAPSAPSGRSSGEPDDAVVTILMPVFNDWSSCAGVLAQLQPVLAQESLSARVLIVDDGSTTACRNDFATSAESGLTRVEVLHLRRNVGHQRAICIGLSYIESRGDCGAVIVMDADGEDDPAELPRMLARFHEEGREKIVFAARARRSERLTFRVFYYLYLLVHRVLTGFGVRIGNYSVIPRNRLRSLVVVPELWSHYAASVIVSRQPYCSVPTTRAKRLDGVSTMNFAALVNHGLTAMSVFSPIVGVRLLMAASGLAVISVIAILVAAALKFFTTLAIPGWTTYTVGILFLVLLQSLLSVVIFSFIILANRNAAVLIPTRDYQHFVDRCEVRFAKECPAP